MSKMLKLKDGVDPEVLLKYGFVKRYDEETGQVCAYRKEDIKEKYLGLCLEYTVSEKRISVFRRLIKNTNKVEWRIHPYTEYFDIETLYDLISDNLIEKCKGD